MALIDYLMPLFKDPLEHTAHEGQQGFDHLLDALQFGIEARFGLYLVLTTFGAAPFAFGLSHFNFLGHFHSLNDRFSSGLRMVYSIDSG
jgi:hypothetical protein